MCLTVINRNIVFYYQLVELNRFFIGAKIFAIAWGFIDIFGHFIFWPGLPAFG